jgi:hypothetical protein
MFDNVKEGDKVTRLLGGILPMPLTVTSVTDTVINCGDYKFAKSNGAEIDDDLKWNTEVTGSYLKPTE